MHSASELLKTSLRCILIFLELQYWHSGKSHFYIVYFYLTVPTSISLPADVLLLLPVFFCGILSICVEYLHTAQHLPLYIVYNWPHTSNLWSSGIHHSAHLGKSRFGWLKMFLNKKIKRKFQRMLMHEALKSGYMLVIKLLTTYNTNKLQPITQNFPSG